MKNKGFTLIELLAVIVILAIIALIAVPILLNVIEKSRDEANERSIELYADAIKNGLATYQLHNDDEVPTGTYSSETLPFTVNYNGDVECDSIKIRENKKLTLSNCKVNGEEVNYIYGAYTLGDHIISSNGGYSKTIDLKGDKKIVETERQISVYSTLYFSDQIEIDYKNHKFKLVGNVEQKSLADCLDVSCGIYASFSIESSYVYKEFSYASNAYYLEVANAKEMFFDYEYNDKTGTGLYKTEDSLGDSYYFRGDVKNNYVKLSGKEIIHHEAIKEEVYGPVDVITEEEVQNICGEDQDCLQEGTLILNTYPKLLFPTKEDCESGGNDMGIWTTCEVVNIQDIYQVDEDTPVFFKSEQECVDVFNIFGAEITSCKKYTLKNEAAYDEVVYNDAYYRIVRINGDGTIRLIYDGDSLVENGKTHTATTTSTLDTWYQKNIVNNSFEKYITESTFQENVGETYYTYHDVYWSGNSGTGIGDRYYVNHYVKSNPNLKQGKILTKKVGLLSAPEAVLAGTLGPISNNYLSGSSFKTSTLSNNSIYVDTCSYCGEYKGDGWCMGWVTESCAKEKNYYYVVNDKGVLTTSETGSIRPVINLIADVPFTGEGTINNPYVIKSY